MKDGHYSIVVALHEPTLGPSELERFSERALREIERAGGELGEAERVQDPNVPAGAKGGGLLPGVVRAFFQPKILERILRYFGDLLRGKKVEFKVLDHTAHHRRELTISVESGRDLEPALRAIREHFLAADEPATRPAALKSAAP